MKIYEIGTGYTPIPAQMGAATEIVVEELTRSFLNIGEKAEIIDIEAEKRIETDLPITDVPVPRAFTKTDVSLGVMHKIKRVIYSMSLAQKLKKILRKTDEKIVLHFHNQYNMFFFLKLVPKKLLKNVTLAYTVHSYVWGARWEEIKDTVDKRYFQEIFCVKNADVVFVLNDITEEHFVKHFNVDKKKIKKVINGVNTKVYKPQSDDEMNDIKQKLEIENKKILFQVGSVCERKNQLGTVKMICDYLKQNADVIYMYAGGIIDVDYQRQIQNFSKENRIEEQVKYVGEVSPGKELAAYYAISDLCIFSSNVESFGLVVIEAIASEKTVLIKNKIMFDLNSGYEIYSNQKDLVEKIDSILNGKLVNNGRQEVIEKYDWDVVAKGHSEVFRNSGN